MYGVGGGRGRRKMAVEKGGIEGVPEERKIALSPYARSA